MLYCRFCAEIKQYNELFPFSDDNIAQKHVLNVIGLLNIDCLDTSNNKLPKTICESCYIKVNEIHNFLTKVKEAQIYLNSLYNLKDETECDINIDNCELNNQIKSDDEPEIYLEKQEIDDDVEIKHEYPIIAENSNLQSVSKSSTQKSMQIKELYSVTCKNKLAKSQKNPSNNKYDVEIKHEYPMIAENSHSQSVLKTFTHKSKQIKKLSSVACKDKSENKLKIPNNDKLKWRENNPENSWLSYPWHCIHCKVELANIEEVRTHSKEKHSICYGFKCVDCCKRFNTFKRFIKHIREHREILRCHCEYCNEKFDSYSQCLNHTSSHCTGVQKTCNMCGEVLSDSKALELHKSTYEKFTYRVMRTPKLIATNAVSNCGTRAASWIDYDWSCQICNLNVSNADTLRNHVQNAHNRCFSIKCMDCVMIMKNFDQFVSHVHKHRPYLKTFCQYCNKSIENQQLLNTHINNHIRGEQKQCEGCGQIFENNELLEKHMKLYVVFKPKQSVTAEYLTCNVCNKSYSSIYILREHKKTHDDKRERQYTCESCGKAFLALGTLKEHIKTHDGDAKTHVCKICQKAFYTKNNLKDHAFSHLKEKPCKCDECGRTFTTKVRLNYHLKSHTGYKPHVCEYCKKLFRFKHDLKIHLHKHTGLRPYACEFCDKTFANRGNCNKHMIAMHGVLLGKKKESNVKTIDDKTKEWMETL